MRVFSHLLFPDLGIYKTIHSCYISSWSYCRGNSCDNDWQWRNAAQTHCTCRNRTTKLKKFHIKITAGLGRPFFGRGFGPRFARSTRKGATVDGGNRWNRHRFGWWFQILNQIWSIHIDSYISNGLRPPTSRWSSYFIRFQHDVLSAERCETVRRLGFWFTNCYMCGAWSGCRPGTMPSHVTHRSNWPKEENTGSELWDGGWIIVLRWLPVMIPMLGHAHHFSENK